MHCVKYGPPPPKVPKKLEWQLIVVGIAIVLLFIAICVGLTRHGISNRQGAIADISAMVHAFAADTGMTVYATQNCKGGSWGGTCWISTDRTKGMKMVRCRRDGYCWVVQEEPG